MQTKQKPMDLAPVSPVSLKSKFCLNYQHVITSQPISWLKTNLVKPAHVVPDNIGDKFYSKFKALANFFKL